MDVRLAASLLLSLTAVSLLGEGRATGCLSVQPQKVSPPSATSVELLCFRSGSPLTWWRGTGECDVDNFTVYPRCNSSSCIIERGEFDTEPVTIFCCSATGVLNEEAHCEQIVVCPSATFTVLPAVIAGEVEKAYISLTVKPWPAARPNVTVSLQGPGLSHLDPSDITLDVTTKYYPSGPLGRTYIYSFRVPTDLPNTTTLQFIPQVGHGAVCDPVELFARSDVPVLVNTDPTLPTQPTNQSTTQTESTASPDLTATSCFNKDLIAVFVLVAFIAGAISSACVSLVGMYISRRRRKSSGCDSPRQGYSNSQVTSQSTLPNGSSNSGRSLPRMQLHLNGEPAAAGRTPTTPTPTETDTLIDHATANPADTPRTPNGHSIHSLVSQRHEPPRQLEFGGGVQSHSRRRTPSTPSGRALPPLPPTTDEGGGALRSTEDGGMAPRGPEYATVQGTTSVYGVPQNGYAGVHHGRNVHLHSQSSSPEVTTLV